MPDIVRRKGRENSHSLGNNRRKSPVTIPQSEMKGELFTSTGPPGIQGTRDTMKMALAWGSWRKVNADILAGKINQDYVDLNPRSNSHGKAL